MSSSISSSERAPRAAARASGPLRFLAAAGLTMLGVLAGLWVLTGDFRTGFLAPEYGVWAAKRAMVEGCRLGATVILGDSRMVAGIEPRDLGDAANLALGGATPIEMYYTLRRALACPHPPRWVVISFSPAQLMGTEYFWQRTALFGFLDFAELEEVRRESRRLGDTSLYSAPNLGDFDAILTDWLYAHHFPSYYISSIVNGRVIGRRAAYHRLRQSVEAQAGHRLYGQDHGTGRAAEEAGMRRFQALPLLDDYFAKLVTLAAQHGVEVDYIAAPWSDATYAHLQPGFKPAFEAYLRGYARRFRNFRLVAPLTRMADGYFGDPYHLNAAGAAVFSLRVAALLGESGGKKAGR